MIANYNISEGLGELIEILDKKGNLIVPIARRGIRTLELSPLSKGLFNKGMILFYDSIKFHINDLKEKKIKKIILFDESVNTGKTLIRFKNAIEQLSNKNKLNLDDKIFTAALLVNQDAKKYPYYYRKKLCVNADLFDRLGEKLHYEILSTGKPMDVDHIIAKIEFPKEVDFESILLNNFNAKESGHSNIYENVRMYTIDYKLSNQVKSLQLNIPNIEFLKFFNGGPQKIRFYVKHNIVHVVPIAFPSMEINNDILSLKEKCPLKINNEDISLCCILNNCKFSKDSILQSIICYNCVINVISTSLLSDFLVELKKLQHFTFKGIDENCLQVVSHTETIALRKLIEEKLKKSIENLKPILIKDCAKIYDYELKGSKFDNEISTIKDDYIKFRLRENDIERIIRVQPEVEISTAVKCNLDGNKSLFNGYYEGTDTKPNGLSYSQIEKMMQNMDPSRFSDGMDVALDVGYLKPLPLTNFKGIKIFSDGQPYNAIVRLYTTASEDVGDSLECFLNLITPKK